MQHAIIASLICAVFTLPAASQSTSGNIVAGAGYLYPAPVAVAPGQVITLFVTGNVQGQVSVTVGQGSDNYPAPVLGVRPAPVCASPQNSCTSLTAVTVQIPFEIRPICLLCAAAVTLPTELFVTQNGLAGPSFELTPLDDRVHVLTTCDTAVPAGTGYGSWSGLPCAPFITHADSSLVTAQSPAQGDEVLVAYAVGLGATNPATATGQAPTQAVPTQESFLLSFDYVPNALPAQPLYPPGAASLTTYAYPRFTGLSAGYVGLYQINFVVPPPPAVTACGGPVQSNLTVNIGGQSSFDGAGICVAPAQ